MTAPVNVPSVCDGCGTVLPLEGGYSLPATCPNCQCQILTCEDRCFNINCTVCRLIPCGVCGHTYGEHYTTNDGTYDGCGTCSDCEGFGDPADMELLP